MNRSSHQRPTLAFRIRQRIPFVVFIVASLLAAVALGAWAGVIYDRTHGLTESAPAVTLDATGIVPGLDVEPTPDEVSQPGTLTTPEWAPDGMPPCPTEDSWQCWWDAAQQGNGTGRSFVAQDGFIIYTDGLPAPSQPGTADPAPAPVDAAPAPSAPAVVNEDPAQWHPMDEGMLICGPDAKPALDYNPHNGYGWWAYCEPALVD